MPCIHETTVGIRLSGDDLEPGHVSLASQCEPDGSARKGGFRETPRGNDLVARTGLWLKSVPLRVPGDLDAQVAELLALMTGDLGVWRRLTATFRSDVFCGLFMENWNEGISISPVTLLALGSRGLQLDLDIYGPAPEP